MKYYYKITKDFKTELIKIVPGLFEKIYLNKVDVQKQIRALFYYISFGIKFYEIDFEWYQTLTQKQIFDIFDIDIEPRTPKAAVCYNEIISLYKSIFPLFSIELKCNDGKNIYTVSEKGLSKDLIALINKEKITKEKKDHCLSDNIKIDSPTLAKINKESEKDRESEILSTNAEADLIHNESLRSDQDFMCEIVNSNSKITYNDILTIEDLDSLSEHDLSVYNLCKSSFDVRPLMLPSVKEKQYGKANSGRVFNKSQNISSFSRETREKIFSGKNIFTSDIKSSQLCLMANYLNIKSIKDFLKTGKSVWQEFADFLGITLTPHLKNNVFKKALYSIIYGAEKWSLLNVLGIYYKLLDHFIFQDLLIARKEWLVKYKNSTIKDCYGTIYNVTGKNYKSVLACMMQNLEFKILTGLTRRLNEGKVKILYHLHDAICYKSEKNLNKIIDDELNKIQIDMFKKNINLRMEHK